VASQRKVNATILITPYDSMDNIARDKFGIFPVSLLLRNHYRSSEAASSLTSPALLVAAQNDMLIPIGSTLQLQKSWQGSVLLTISDVAHNSIIDSPELLEQMNQFLQNNAPHPKSF